jgi:hypothetical protein
MISQKTLLELQNQIESNITLRNNSLLKDTGDKLPNNNVANKAKGLDIKQIFSITQIEQIPGETRLFSVYNANTTNYDEINATLKVVGPHSLIYSNFSSTEISDSTLLAINHSFNNIIYPNLTRFFGSPPDIDSNGKTIILILDIQDRFGGPQYIAGFFDPTHQYPVSQAPESEESEILHIDGNEGKSNLDTGKYDVIAHELQHMIHFGIDNDEETWLDEGASMFSEYLIGEDPFETSTYKNAFSSNSDVSLTYWDYYDNNSLLFANYASAYVFYRYLAEKFGGSDVIKNLVNHPENGIKSIEKTLNDSGHIITFPELFRNWTIANLLNNVSLANGSYGYENLTFTMGIEQSYSTFPISRTENTVPYWGTDYLEFDISINNPFTFEFQGTNTSEFLVTAILTNITSSPQNTVIFPVELSNFEIGTFSTELINMSADKINIVVSSYPKLGTPNHNNTISAPHQQYWFTVNPQGLAISSGIFLQSNYGEMLHLWNISVLDVNGDTWYVADGAFFEIFTEDGISTTIVGTLFFNITANYWETGLINISTLNVGSYRVKYHFFNTTSSGMAYSPIFKVIEIVLNPGNVIFNEKGDYLTLSNVTVIDSHGTLVKSLEGAFYEIFTEGDISTGITGMLFFNNTAEYWETGLINTTNLPDGLYYSQLHFYNSTVGTRANTLTLRINRNSTTQPPVSSSGTTTTTQLPITTSNPLSQSSTQQTDDSSTSSIPSSTSEFEITPLPGPLFLLLVLSQLVLIGKKIKRKRN